MMKGLEYRPELVKSLAMDLGSLRIAEELCATLEFGAGSRILDLAAVFHLQRGRSTLFLQHGRQRHQF